MKKESEKMPEKKALAVISLILYDNKTMDQHIQGASDLLIQMLKESFKNPDFNTLVRESLAQIAQDRAMQQLYTQVLQETSHGRR